MSDMLTPADLAARRSRDRAVVMGYAKAYRFRQAFEESGVAIAADTEWDGKRARILHYQQLGSSIAAPVAGGPFFAELQP